MDELRKLLVVLGVAGALGFGAALAASFVHPRAVESMAREVIRAEVEQKVEAYFRSGIKPRIGSSEQTGARLNGFIRTKYAQTAAKLTREFRIFTGANAVVFALLTVAVILKAPGAPAVRSPGGR